MTKADGGPAFPVLGAISEQIAPNMYSAGPGATGMSLRDYYAGQALAGMGTWWPNTPPGQMLHEAQDIQRVRAEYAYAQADAMLEARGR